MRTWIQPLQRLWEDEGGWGAVDLLTAILLMYGVYILMMVGVTFVHAIPAVVVGYEYGQATAQDQNMIDPNTNQPIGQELVSAFSSDFPVSSSNISYTTAPTYGEAGPNQLLVALVSNNGFVTETIDYGLVLPIRIPTWSGTTWTSVEPAVTPFHFSMSFFQEWQS